MTTIFGKIIEGEVPAEKVYENERILVIKDLYPKAPVHLLIIPKKEIPDLQTVTEDDLPLMGEIVQVAQKLAEEYKITEGYRLIVNNGPLSGQSISHLHFHLMGGPGHKLGSMG